MSEAVQWQGMPIEVEAWAVPRFCWCTASIDVFLGEQCILRTGGQLKLAGSYSARFMHLDSAHTADLSWGVEGWRGFPYKLKIDGDLISEGKVYAQNGFMGLLMKVIIGTVLAMVAIWIRRHLFNQT